jgi:hypothetical protein
MSGMEAAQTESSSSEGQLPKTRAEQQKIVAQMELILASQHFSHSKRSQLLFRYIVAKTLLGQVSILKERTLGIEVFGRAPDYDTNADPIVRMTAGEIRKRIAQYYHDSVHRDELRIDLTSGSYTAQFHLPKSVGDPQETNAGTPPAALLQEITPDLLTEHHWLARHLRSTWTRWLGLFSALAFISFIAWYFVLARQHSSYTELAWGDILDNRSTTLIAVGGRSLNSNPYSTANPKWTIDQASMSASDHMNAESLSYSEARALVRLVRILDGENVQYNLLSVGETTFANLRQGPAILLGGLNNPWTIRAQEQLRYRLATDNNGLDWISDARDPGSRKFLIDVRKPYSSLNADYAIVARFYDSNTQKPTLIVAGLAEDGTKAASEFITDEKQLQVSVGGALRGSKGKNFEVVLGTQVINGVSGPPRVLAKEIW